MSLDGSKIAFFFISNYLLGNNFSLISKTLSILCKIRLNTILIINFNFQQTTIRRMALNVWNSLEKLPEIWILKLQNSKAFKYFWNEKLNSHLQQIIFTKCDWKKRKKKTLAKIISNYVTDQFLYMSVEKEARKADNNNAWFC